MRGGRFSIVALGGLALLVAGCRTSTPPADDSPTTPGSPMCTASLSWTGAPAPSMGGGHVLQVVPDQCPMWTAVADVPWITFEAASDGVAWGQGSGAVFVRAAPNPGARRLGTATVAWTTITVDQAGSGGSGCSFQVMPTEQAFTGGLAGTGSFAILPSATNCGWTVTRASLLEDTVFLESGGAGDVEHRWGMGPATIAYSVRAAGPMSPWVSAPIHVRDSALAIMASHQVTLTTTSAQTPTGPVDVRRSRR